MKTINFFITLICIVMTTACAQTPQQPQAGESNEVIETIMARRSIRKYKDATISRDTLNVIMECGINAPNGQNKQSWEIRVVDNPALLNEMSEAMAAAHPDIPAEFAKGCFRGAPVMVFIARPLL